MGLVAGSREACRRPQDLRPSARELLRGYAAEEALHGLDLIAPAPIVVRIDEPCRGLRVRYPQWVFIAFSRNECSGAS